jgi:hypothetical protein
VVLVVVVVVAVAVAVVYTDVDQVTILGFACAHGAGAAPYA